MQDGKATQDKGVEQGGVLKLNEISEKLEKQNWIRGLAALLQESFYKNAPHISGATGKTTRVEGKLVQERMPLTAAH